jgi:ribosomal protein S13
MFSAPTSEAFPKKTVLKCALNEICGIGEKDFQICSAAMIDALYFYRSF